MVVDPAIIAFSAMDARSDFLSGTIDPNAASVIPMEAKLLNPHRAYVDIVWERSCLDIE